MEFKNVEELNNIENKIKEFKESFGILIDDYFEYYSK